MSRPAPAFTQVDAQRLIKAAMACGLKNYTIKGSKSGLALVVTDQEIKIEPPIDEPEDTGEPEPKV